MLKKLFVSIFAVFLLSISGLAQEPQISWKRNKPATKPKLLLFHSIHAVNLPTAETLQRGEFEYEISHRFIPTVGEKNAYFGIDGPANIRTALAYAITNSILINLGRSNLNDNYDLRVKFKALKFRHPIFPMLFAVRAGAAWSTEVVGRKTAHERNFQYYGQLIWNTMFWKRLGIGLVPSYLYNSHIYCKDTEDSFTIGGYVQFYISAMISVYLETNQTVFGYRDKYNPLVAGIELETGGHFFKIFFGNSQSLNPSQYLSGADLRPLDEWRLGFNITRILKL